MRSYLSLATFRANGTEVATPVWYVAVDGRLYVFTAGDAGKVKRLRPRPVPVWRPATRAAA